MKKSLLRLAGWVLLLPAVVSCNANIFSPFGADNTDEDHREVAIDDLKNGDYNGAVAEYQKLSNPVEVAQMTCTVLVTEAGLTIAALVNTLSPSASGGTSSNTALGDLAQSLTPWTAAKAAAIASALTNTDGSPGPCPTFRTSSPGTLSNLLNAAAVFVDAGLRLARTTVQLGTADPPTPPATTPPEDTTCTTPQPDTSGLVSKSDVGGDPTTGAISAAEPGMCASDAHGILTDFISLNTLVQDPQLQNLASTYNNLVKAHPELQNAGTADPAIRLAVKSFIKN